MSRQTTKVPRYEQILNDKEKLGVWLGATSLYIPALLKPAPAQLRLLLWALFSDQDSLPEIPPAGLCTIKVDKTASRVFYEVSGYRVVGNNAVRLDMLERLANAAREVSMRGPFPMDADLMSLVGTSGDDFIEIMSYLGYVTKEYNASEAAEILAKRKDTEKADQDVSAEKPAEDVPTDNAVDNKNSQDAKSKLTEQPEKVIIFTHKPEGTRHNNRIRKPQVGKGGKKTKERHRRKVHLEKPAKSRCRNLFSLTLIRHLPRSRALKSN